MMLMCNEVGKNTKKYVMIIFVTAESLKKKDYIRKEEIKMMYVVKKMIHRNTH